MGPESSVYWRGAKVPGRIFLSCTMSSNRSWNGPHGVRGASSRTSAIGHDGLGFIENVAQQLLTYSKIQD